MALQEQQVRRTFSRKRILLPILIGLGVAVWMLWSSLTEVKYYEVAHGTGSYTWVDGNQNQLVDFTSDEDFVAAEKGNYEKLTYREALREVEWGWLTGLSLLCAVLMMVIRDFSYMWRIRILTEKKLSWRQSFDVILIWEFTSALTPGIVGGSAVAMFILNREKISMGKATALVLITALMDELFYVIIVPVTLLIAGTASLFPIEFSQSILGMELNITSIFWIGFGIISLLSLLLFSAIFVAPHFFRNMLVFFCRLPFLRRFREKARKTGDDLILTSRELRGKPFGFWFWAMVATFASWTARFLVINFVILAFSPMADQFVVFARQLSMWVILLVTPTPGGSGVAEVAFSGFLQDFIPFGLAGILALLWRLISYYPYLFIGALILPGWFQKTAAHRSKSPSN